MEYLKLKISPESLQIDTSKYIEVIEQFIKSKMKELRRDGIVVPISGGLDSSVAAALCVNVVGKDNVRGLMLPEKQGNPDAEVFGKLIAKHLGIKTKTINISPMLKSMGTYKFDLSFLPGRKLKEFAVKTFLKQTGESLF